MSCAYREQQFYYYQHTEAGEGVDLLKTKTKMKMWLEFGGGVQLAH
jgi:hypothetical protein